MAKTEKDGLFLRGVLQARRRREVRKSDGGLRYCISLFVQTPDRVVQADRWTDSPTRQGVPSVGDRVEVEVSVGAYLSHGVAMARVNWGEADAAGTDF